MESRQIGARRNHPHLLRLVVVVEGILLFDFVGGRCDHQFSRRQGLLLRLDAARHLVARFDQVTLEAGGQQATALDPPERMAGMDKRHAEKGRQALADVAGIAIVAVHDVRRQPLGTQKSQGIVGEGIQVIP
jgi:hypothetical protein